LAAAYIFVPGHRYKFIFITIAFIALLLRFAIVLYIYRDGCDTFGTDGLLYHKTGIQIAKQLDNGVSIVEVKYSYTWYTVFIGVIYHLFGVNRYFASFINAFFAFLSGMILFKIALRRKYSFENSALVSLAFLYFPNIFLWTSDTRKEALMFLVSFLIWFLVQNILVNAEDRRKILYISMQTVLTCFLIWIATLIRIYLFIPIIAGIIISLLVHYAKSRDKVFCMVIMTTVILSTAAIYITTVNTGIQNHHAIHFPESQTDDPVESLNNKIHTLEKIAIRKNFLASLLNCLTLPRPGNVDIADIKGMGKIIFCVQFEMFVWYICLFLMFTGIYSALKDRDGCFIGILAYIAFYILINAVLVESDSGTIYRYRAQIVGFSMLFIDWSVIRKILSGLIFHITKERYRGYTC